MNLAEVRRVVIEEGCNLVIDLRDNPYVRTLVVKDNFIGRINLSRSSITKIRIGSNCRCDLIIHDSRECFKLAAADVFSGRLDIENSCFHHLTFGYYCYADLRLQDNCGRKRYGWAMLFGAVWKPMVWKFLRFPPETTAAENHIETGGGRKRCPPPGCRRRF